MRARTKAVPAGAGASKLYFHNGGTWSRAALIENVLGLRSSNRDLCTLDEEDTCLRHLRGHVLKLPSQKTGKETVKLEASGSMALSQIQENFQVPSVPNSDFKISK